MNIMNVSNERHYHELISRFRYGGTNVPSILGKAFLEYFIILEFSDKIKNHNLL